MVNTSINLPAPLLRRVRALAEAEELSSAEWIRRELDRAAERAERAERRTAAALDRAGRREHA